MLVRRLIAAALLAALWSGPATALAGNSMLSHMMLHLAVIAVVPMLIAPRLGLRATPVLLAAAALVEMVAVWGWHAPAAHLLARESGLGFALEQASFLGAGLFLWAAVEAAGRLGGAAVLLGTVMHMTLLGALIGLSPRLLYGADGICAFGFDRLADQQLAGAAMAGVGGALYLAAALARLAPALRAEVSP